MSRVSVLGTKDLASGYQPAVEVTLRVKGVSRIDNLLNDIPGISLTSKYVIDGDIVCVLKVCEDIPWREVVVTLEGVFTLHDLSLIDSLRERANDAAQGSFND